MTTRQTGPARAMQHEPQTPPHPAPDQGRKDPVAQGAKLPSAPRPPQAAPPQELRPAARTPMSTPMNTLDPVTDPRAFWAAVSGVAPDQLIFAPGPARRTRRRARVRDGHPWILAGAARLLRLWRILWFGPHHPDPAPLPVTPLNLAPWTNTLLPDPRAAPGRSGLARLGDHLLWHLSHPATRYETCAWRSAARADQPLIWRLRALRNTLAGKPSGPPPWIDAAPAEPAAASLLSQQTREDGKGRAS